MLPRLLLALAGELVADPAPRVWTHIGPHGFPRVHVSSLAFDAGAEHLYAATNEGVFRRARNEGDWSITGDRTLGVLVLTVDLARPRTIYAGTVITQGPGALRSDDGGETWRAIPPNGAVIALATDPRLPDTVLAIAHFIIPGFPHIGPHPGGIYKSTDGGNSWRNVHPFGMQGGGIAALAIDPRDPRIMYAGAWQAGVFKSEDGGESWRPINTGFDGDAVHALLVEPVGGIVLAGTDRGLIRSGDGGAHWVRSSLGLPHRAVLSFAFDPLGRTIYAGTNGAGLFRSEDGGLRWVEVQPTLPNQVIVSLAIDPVEGTIYAGTQRNGVFRKPIDRELSHPRSPRRVPFRGN